MSGRGETRLFADPSKHIGEAYLAVIKGIDGDGSEAVFDLLAQWTVEIDLMRRIDFDVLVVECLCDG